MIISSFIIAQIIGLVAMALCIFTWQQKDARKIILWYSPVNILWSLHFVVLGAYSGAAVAIVNAIKDGMLAYIRPQYIALLIFSYIAIVWIATLYHIEHWYGFIPLIATTIFNIVLLIDRDNRYAIARCGLMSNVSWIIYNCFVGGWVGIACSTFVICSTLTGMIRHENWKIGRCYKTFAPSVARSLFSIPRQKLYP